MPVTKMKLRSNWLGLKAIFLTATLPHYNLESLMPVHSEQDEAYVTHSERGYQKELICPEEAVSMFLKTYFYEFQFLN